MLELKRLLIDTLKVKKLDNDSQVLIINTIDISSCPISWEESNDLIDFKEGVKVTFLKIGKNLKVEIKKGWEWY